MPLLANAATGTWEIANEDFSLFSPLEACSVWKGLTGVVPAISWSGQLGMHLRKVAAPQGQGFCRQHFSAPLAPPWLGFRLCFVADGPPGGGLFMVEELDLYPFQDLLQGPKKSPLCWLFCSPPKFCLLKQPRKAKVH